jgi:acyl-CoA synthetase (AMP-forming)/AMP-acid ligase II
MFGSSVDVLSTCRSAFVVLVPIDAKLTKLRTAATLAGTGMVGAGDVIRPRRLASAFQALGRWGPTPAAGYAASAVRYPDRPAVIDERGALSFADMHRRSNALARALGAGGVGEGDRVALMCRNHRHFVEAVLAASKLGADALYLNTGFAGPQVADVVAREDAAVLVFDEEFADAIRAGGRGCMRIVAWSDGGATADPLLEDLIANGDPTELVPPRRRGRPVILTSGTTGTPKGASPRPPESLAPAAALFSRIPLRARQFTMIAAPMFHSWGLAHFSLGVVLSSTLVLRRRADPEAVLAATAAHRCTALIVVPVTLQRILDLPAAVLRRYDVSALRVIATSGSALPGELARRVMDVFGEVLYNLYGATEVGFATVATPIDLRSAPGTAGRPPPGTAVRVLDQHGVEVPPGTSGRIFVGNEMQIDAYRDGGGKQVVGGLMSSGDVGHFDGAGRLFVDGRDDEMIVSGGENVFPREVEDAIAGIDGVLDVTVVGVPDDDFGQRLRACVVRSPGAELTADDVRAHVKRTLARYKVPRDVDFLDELPRTSTGKVLKRELRPLSTAAERRSTVTEHERTG